jgi:hypothetical protein
MMTKHSRAAFVVVLASGLLLSALPGAKGDDEPSADDVLKKVDDVLFFYDKQEKLESYTVEAVEAGMRMTPGKAPEPAVDKDSKVNKIEYDAKTGKKKQTDSTGADVPPVTWMPGCGPWRLDYLMAFEIQLFSKPLSTTFDKESWDRTAEKADAGWKLKLTPKTVPAGDMLRPAITGLEMEIDKDGVPTKAVLHLDQKIMSGDGTVTFKFADLKAAKKKRIESIEHELVSANLKVTPKVVFVWNDKDKSGFVVLQTIEFHVPGRQLSGSLGGDMASFLVFRNFKAKKGK